MQSTPDANKLLAIIKGGAELVLVIFQYDSVRIGYWPLHVSFSLLVEGLLHSWIRNNPYSKLYLTNLNEATHSLCGINYELVKRHVMWSLHCVCSCGSDMDGFMDMKKQLVINPTQCNTKQVVYLYYIDILHEFVTKAHCSFGPLACHPLWFSSFPSIIS